MIYYHGSKFKFDKFDLSFSNDGFIYFTPCYEMAKIYAIDGYIYTCEILNTKITDCNCVVTDNINSINILKIDKIETKTIKPIQCKSCNKILIPFTK